MTFTDKWGTSYPESSRNFVNPGSFSNMDRNLLDIADKITISAKDTDEAVMAIHEFIKNIESNKMEWLENEQTLNATTILKNLLINPKKSLSPSDKSILEVSLLRSVDIPARIGMYYCDIKNTSFLSNRRIKSMFTKPKAFHYSTEVFVPNEINDGNFKIKDSWIPESECNKHPNTCTIEEKIQWFRSHEVMGIQGIVNCNKIRSDKDYPQSLGLLKKLGTEARNYSHFIDIFDPVD